MASERLNLADLDPLAATLAARQPNARFEAFASDWVDDQAAFHQASLS